LTLILLAAILYRRKPPSEINISAAGATAPVLLKAAATASFIVNINAHWNCSPFRLDARRKCRAEIFLPCPLAVNFVTGTAVRILYPIAASFSHAVLRERR
jgi:hypothetical protein